MDHDDLLTGLEGEAPDRPAVIGAAGDVLSRGDVAGLLRGLAESARPWAGRRFAALMPDEPQAALALLALTRDCSVLPLNPGLTDDQLSALIIDAGCHAVIGGTGLAGRAGALAARAGLGSGTAEGDRITVDGPVPPGGIAPGLVLLTSGSTGQPKRVPLATGQLFLSARNIAAHLRLSPGDRAVHALPVFHIGALVDLLLAPLLSGGSLAFAADRGAEALARTVLQARATWLQLVPTMLAHCLADLDRDRLAAMGRHLRFVRMVSADLSADRQAEAEAALGGVPLLQMYGMTETAGQIASNPLPPAPRKPGSVGPAAGAEIAIIDATGAMVAPGGTGEVCVAGPTVTAGYEGDAPTPRHGCWLRTGDLGQIDPDGYLVLTGRAKEIINRGGEKVSPVTVERAALALPGVLEAVAYALPHPTLGEQVGLSVVPRDASLTEDEVLKGLAQRLADFERPRRVVLRPGFPRLGSGKVDRRRLAAEDQAQQRDEGAPAPALSPTGQMVAAAWQAALKGPAPLAEDDFFDQGGDSLTATEFLLDLERRLGQALPPNLLFDQPRFAGLVAATETALSARPARRQPRILRFIARQISGWGGQAAGQSRILLARNTVAPGRPVFFCVNEPQVADAFTASIGQDRPHYILSSGLGLRARNLWDKRLLERLYTDEIMALQPEGPLVIGGFCEGGVLMQAVADRLKAKGRDIRLFLALDVIFETPTDYPVVHVWTASRRFSMKGLYDQPMRGLGHLHPAGAARFIIPGFHQNAIRAETLAPFAAQIGRFIDRAPPAPRPHGKDIPLETRKRRWKAALSARLPMRMTAGERRTIQVRVKNLSPETWPPSPDSGLGVEANFVSWKRPEMRPLLVWSKRLVGPKAPAARFDAPVPPGTGLAVSVTVAAPQRPGLYILRLSMVDDGFGHFLGRWRQALVRPVWVRAG